MKSRALMFFSALLLTCGLAQATVVTYTFTGWGTDQNNQQFKTFQLTHTSDHFLDPATYETQEFSLADITFDPWASAGGTTNLGQCAASGVPGNFTAISGFIEFGGVCFFNSSNQEAYGFSDDIHVTDMAAGTWSNTVGSLVLDVVASSDPNPNNVPEPTTAGLMGAALFAYVAARRTRRGKRAGA